VAWLHLSEPVREAVAAGRPVVALESTILTHGLPRPQNLAAALEFEAILDDAGVAAATIAVIDGAVRVGLDHVELQHLATEPDVVKLSARDLPVAVATGVTGATTVAATAHLAHRAGIRVFATGGIGGVHRQAAQTFDESADLTTLAMTPVTVVSAGVKSILDIPATLERLESLGVTVVGWRTDRFPGFWITDSGSALDWSVTAAETVAAIMAANDELGRSAAVLVANPLPPHLQLHPAVHDQVLEQALEAAERAGLRGKAVTPFLLAHIEAATTGSSLAANLSLVRGNVALAAQIARAWSSLQRGVQA